MCAALFLVDSDFWCAVPRRKTAWDGAVRRQQQWSQGNRTLNRMDPTRHQRELRGLQSRRSKPTILDVAAAAGVSKSTVSRVIRQDSRVAETTRQAVEQAIRQLGYVPAMSAQLMRAEPAPTIGLLISSIDIPIFAQLNRYLHEGLTELGFHVIQQTVTHSTRESNEAALENLASMPIQGMLVSVGGVESEQHLRFAQRMPLVVVGRPEPTGQLDTVGFDEEAHARLIVDHLIELGHTRIMMQEAPQDRSMGTWMRAEAQKAYAASKGLDFASAITFGMKEQDLIRWVDAVHRDGYTAITGLFDRNAIAVLRATKKLGIDVPGQLSVTGSDGVLEGLDLIGLTTVRKPVETVGRMAARRIVEMIQSDGADSERMRHLVAGELVVGTTTGRVN